ncbi:MAG TPA: hypothetical protein VGI10_15085 [Polyangiaceae bacterium]|jgi:hypothetical protein
MMKLKYLAFALVLGMTAACGSSDKGGSTPAAANNVPAVGQTVTVSITAASGGDVAIGSAKLSIPPGALSADTDITLTTEAPASSLPEAATVQGPVYDFGPAGTTFSTPAPLTLPLPSAPSSGQTAVVSWLDTTSNAWQDLDTTVSAGAVTAAVPHFTMFVVRFKGGGTGPVDCSFSACGGDITGAWTITAGCFNSNSSALSGCPTATVMAQTDVAGMVTFNADSTYSVNLTESGTINAEVPTSCLSGTTCDAFGTSNQVACTADTTGCACTKAIMPANSSESGTYTTSGTTFTTTKTGDTPGTPNQYCVTGSTLKVQTTDSNGQVNILIGTK